MTHAANGVRAWSIRATGTAQCAGVLGIGIETLRAGRSGHAQPPGHGCEHPLEDPNMERIEGVPVGEAGQSSGQKA